MSEYISKAIPMLASQDNEVTYLVPWSRLQRPPQEGGVYELVTFQMLPGGPALWGNAFQAASDGPRCTRVWQAGGSVPQRVRATQPSSRPLVVRERRPAS
ncbi:Protein NipSnap-like protein 3A [Larimichthys crocea]|nr:Protein NipSnap-like protein 3A [Larimichthys crocea]